MSSSKFKELIKKLNPEQRLAVETIDGPVMVVAGPGTGKTQILTLRIANILVKTDSRPENILALTFTDSAAGNMRRRLAEIIGTPAYYVNITTFHSFCNKLIPEYPENFPEIVGSTAATPVDQIGLIRKIIDGTNLKRLKPFGNKYYYAVEILKTIRQLKNEGINPAEFKKTISRLKTDSKNEKENQKASELAWVYQKYQNTLRAKKLYDFEDMVLETVKVLASDKNFLLDLQEKYQHLLVDEHQDTNGAQNKTLELLASYDGRPNLFVVGDEKQAIFRFQGACLENFLYFKKKFPAAGLINLVQNYRSSQPILDAAHSLIEKNKTVLALTRLKSQSKPKSDLQKIKVASFNSPEAEHIFVAEKIKEILKKGVPANEIAVLYRDNRDAEPLADVLARWKIPLVIESDEDVLKDPEIKKLHVLFEAVANFAAPEYLAPAMHLDFFNIEPMEIYGSLAQKKISPAIAILNKKIGDWQKLNYNHPFPVFFETIIRDSGYLDNLMARPDFAEKLQKLNAVFGEIKKAVTANHNFKLNDYLEYIKILEEHNLPLRAKTPRRNDSVRLMTAHKAKGLEFNWVFVTGAYNGHWGNRRNVNHFNLPITAALNPAEKNEDERRLFYMALTRARHNVFVTYSTASAEGREQVPCQFIAEIKPELKEEYPLTDQETKSTFKKSSLLAPLPVAPPTPVKNFVKDLFNQRGLSPTSLNNYLDCPWKFFYNNLLRLPKAQARYLIYGNAKHRALQLFFDARRENKKISTKFLTEKFINDLKKYSLVPEDYRALIKKGTKSLTAYYNFYKDSWNYNTANEFKIRGVDFPVSKKETIRLTGKLDKLELGPDNRSAVVVDYKTGKARSRNWILGKTKDSNGGYFRQLVFYKLLLNLMPRKKFEMGLGAIDFIEPLDPPRGKPDDKVRFRKEIFEISTSDVSDLKELIAQTAADILDLKFWNSGCGKKGCEYCALRKLLPKSEVI